MLARHFAAHDVYPMTNEFAGAVLDQLREEYKDDATIGTNELNAFCEEFLKDPWGSPFIYRTDERIGYGIYSAGDDGVSQSGGSDSNDINSWDTEKSWRAYYDRKLRKSVLGHSVSVWIWPIILGVSASVVVGVLLVHRSRSGPGSAA